MRAIITLLFASLLIGSAFAAPVKVKNYNKKSGTQVLGHTRTKPNKTRTDNYSTKGNVNPQTGKAGTIDPFKPRRKK
jgi:hypothetical protein